jgi:uncharacterized protein YqeY
VKRPISDFTTHCFGALAMAWDNELATLAEYVRATFGDDALQAAIDRAVAKAGDVEEDIAAVTTDEFLEALRVQLRHLNYRH